LAADPMPPSASDTYIILKPREEWPDPDLPKDDLIRQFDTEASKLPGNKFGFSQPIEMRFNELIAGVREDLAVKVFGDEFAPMVRAANQIAAVLRGVEGAANVKVEQVSGLPFLEIKIDKGEIARRGLAFPTCRMRSAYPSAVVGPAWCLRAIAASGSWCGSLTRCATISRCWNGCPLPCRNQPPALRR